MLPRLSLAVPAATFLLAGIASGQVFINEIRIDQPGTDDDEYFELVSAANLPLDAYTYVVIGDGTTGSGTIEAAVALTSQSTNGMGLFVASEGTFTLGVADLVTTLNFENSDNVTHLLVEGFTGLVGDDLDTNDDGVLDSTPWTSVVDGVALIEEPNPPSGTEFHYGDDLGLPIVGPDGSFVPGQVLRCLTSATDWRIGSFGTGVTDTPGAFNSNCVAQTSVFCDPPAMNSVSAGGSNIVLGGSGSITLNDNSLEVSPVPDTFGVFVQADATMASMPAAIGGNICVDGTIERMNMIVFAVGNSASLALDFTGPGVEAGTAPGDTVHYQYFHRDTVFGGGGNFSSGLSVTWAP